MTAFATVAQVQQYLGIPLGTDDARIAALITAVSNQIETCLTRSLLSASRQDVRDGNGRQVLVLTDYPVTAVASVVINGQAVPAVPAGDYLASGYRFDGARIILQGNWAFQRGRSNVIIQYTAGYDPNGPDAAVFAQMCIEAVALRYRQAAHIDTSSKSVAGETTAYVQRDFPLSVQTMLNNYKRVAMP